MTNERNIVDELVVLAEGVQFLSLLNFLEDVDMATVVVVEEVEVEIVHATGFCTTEDEELFQSVVALNELSNDLGSDSEVYKGLQKSLTNIVREKIGITSVISFHVNMKNKVLLVFEYDREASDDDHYKVGFDKKLQRPYIIL
ncbi:hypothetical protein ACIGIJ_18945 [Bacillus paranthracis]|uniref:hypothetical protein n=1 Tax=Bacillus paranthracis TaxID=2026186 RepID=UPI0037C5672F